jgi:hypothetical protein
VGYVGSAGIAITVLLAYYLFSFDAEANPFFRSSALSLQDSLNDFRPNPIDQMLAKYIEQLRRPWMHLRSGQPLFMILQKVSA